MGVSTMRHVSWLYCLVAVTICPGAALAEGRLASARRETEGKREEPRSRSSRSDSDDARPQTIHPPRHGHRHRHRDHHRHHHCRDACGSYEAEGFARYESAPRPTFLYASFPYASAVAAYLLDPELQLASSGGGLAARLRSEHVRGREWAGQIALDAGYLRDVAHTAIDMRVLMRGPFELGVRNRFMFEPAANDYSMFGAFELGLRFVEWRSLMVRVLGGPAYFGRFGDGLFGVEAGLGFDAFLGRPFVLSGRGTLAVVGDAVIGQWRLQLGYLIGRSELFLASDVLHVGSVNLSAPVLGVRFWL
jgi:hypothetical protein